MATRFYYGQNLPPEVSPTAASAWDVTTSAFFGNLNTPYFNDGGASNTRPGTGSANTNRLMSVHTSKPLAAQIISGTVKGQSRCNETNATDNYWPQMRIFVVNNLGTAVRGVLMELHSNAISSEFATSLTNRKFPLAALSPVTLTSVVVNAGDRLVVERGWRQDTTSVANGVISFRSTSATDLAEDESTTTANNDWVEFSADIQFYRPSSGASVLMAGEFLRKRLKQIRWRG